MSGYDAPIPPSELALWAIGFTVAVIVFYTIGGFIVLGVFEARDNDPPMDQQPEGMSNYDWREMKAGLEKRAIDRANRAQLWLFILLYNLIFRWICLMFLACGKLILKGLNIMRSIGRWVGKPRVAKSADKSRDSSKESIPTARVITK